MGAQYGGMLSSSDFMLGGYEEAMAGQEEQRKKVPCEKL
jgi:hypothetical protein